MGHEARNKTKCSCSQSALSSLLLACVNHELQAVTESTCCCTASSSAIAAAASHVRLALLLTPVSSGLVLTLYAHSHRSAFSVTPDVD